MSNNDNFLNRFELMDFNETPRKYGDYESDFNSNVGIDLGERAQINKKHQHSKSKKAPDYHQPIENRFEILDIR